MISFRRAIAVGSFVKVMRIHSSASADDDSDGSQASRPNACQLAHANTEPHQFRSVPVLATPASPVTMFLISPGLPERLDAVPWGLPERLDAVPWGLPERPDAVPWGRCVSAFSTSAKSGPR